MEVPQVADLRRRPALRAATRPAHRDLDQDIERAVKATRLPEPLALFKTLTAWRRELLTFCRTRVTNARTEAANLIAKTNKRVGRGYGNHRN